MYFSDSRLEICDKVVADFYPRLGWRPKDWNQSLLRRAPFLWANVSRIANRPHLSPALFSLAQIFLLVFLQLLLIELLKYESLVSSCNWSHFLLHHPHVLPALMIIWKCSESSSFRYLLSFLYISRKVIINDILVFYCFWGLRKIFEINLRRKEDAEKAVQSQTFLN